MSDLVAFLTACLDRDEAVARAANSHGERWWMRATQEAGAFVRSGVGNFRYTVAESDWCLDAEHIARHDPARVLAEVAAKRAVIDHIDRLAVRYGVHPEQMHLTTVALILAQPYAGEDGWKERWRL